jgi:hypothetical protein
LSKPRQIEKNVIWEPIPGSSQELAIDTRCHHTLYHGTRGPGKTITQLMRFRRRVGLGYGAYWRGVIFDCEFKNLSDLVAQSKRFFMQFNDGAKFHESASDFKWTWPTGEELLLRHVKKLSDYDGFHGHEYCLEENQLLPTEDGPVAIKDIEVGNKIYTPNGFKRVARKFNVGLKKCVTVSTYTSDGRLRCSQLQSEDHRLLTNELKFSRAQLHLNCNVLQFDGKIPLQEDFYKLHDDSCPDTQLFSFEQEDGEISSIKFGKILRTFLQDLFSEHLFLRHLEPLLLEYPWHEQDLPIEPHGVLKSFLQSLGHKVSQLEQSLGQAQLVELFLQCQVLKKCLLSVQTPDDLFELHKSLGLTGDCFFGYGLRDELARRGKGTFQFLVQRLLDVLKPILNVPLGDLEVLAEHTRPCTHAFQHPYQKDRLIQSDLELSTGFSFVESAGELPCYDIEVEDVNCYMTYTGIVNKNCFIGWNELTKHPTGELYDKMMSVNRSSFIPERHTPRDRSGDFVTPDKKPLPEIPLEVFSTTNPSGPGHNWVKRRFIDCAKNGEVVKTEVEVFNPRTQKEQVMIKTQVAIFGSYRENIYLSPEYIAELDMLTEHDPNLKRAWLYGDWDVTAGGALDDLWTSSVHILPNFNIPANWYVDRAFDLGAAHPFSVGWWAEANGEEIELPDGRLFCQPRGTLIKIDEWYGAKEIGTNKGLKLSPEDIAVGIKHREVLMMDKGIIKRQPRPGPADNEISSVKIAGHDTVEQMMADKGVRWTKSDKSAGARKHGLLLMRQRLQASLRQEGPGLYFMRACSASIQTLPSLPRDEKDLDDVDTHAEDHAYDEARYRVLAGSNRMAKKIKFTFPN